MKTSERRQIATEVFGEYRELFTESGIQNMRQIAKEYRTAEMWFHIDLDGIATAIAMKEYLKKYGIKLVDAYPIQYGDLEFTTHKLTPGRLHVLVDFAHSKPDIRIHTDHHDGQTGVDKKASSYFVKSPSNATAINQKVSTSQIYSASDAKVIDMVDSANYAVNDITPTNVMNTIFKYDKKLSVDKNTIFFGLVVNKMLLAYKNKKNFLTNIVLKSSPSLKNIFINMKGEAKKLGFDVSLMKQASQTYQDKSKEKMGTKDKLSMMGTTIMTYGMTAGAMKPGSYDRYTTFKLYPDADYQCIAWPMGLLQISKNPFKKAVNPYNLSDVAWGVMNKYKSKLTGEVSLADVKYGMEKKLTAGKGIYGKDLSMNFQFVDFLNLFGDTIKLQIDKGFGKVLQDISKKNYKDLTYKQKQVLGSVKIPVWDIIKKSSGGHHDITNISGLNFIPGTGANRTALVKNIWRDLGKAMKDKHLTGKK